LWDIAGQERFGNMTRVYYKEAVGAIVVFDVTRPATFEAVQKWKNDIDCKVTLPPDERPIPVLLLANKVDLQKEPFQKTPAQMEKYCEENGFIGWFETSAKDNLNIEKAAKTLVAKILENEISRKDDTAKPETNAGIDLTEKAPASSGCSC
jgi:Ras-related protein Rab-32